jgi:sugar lactone lactonase YvrE
LTRPRPGQPSGLGFLPDGRALIISMRDRRVLVRDDAGSLTEHADPSGAVPAVLDDMVVDERGRAPRSSFALENSRELPNEPDRRMRAEMGNP